MFGSANLYYPSNDMDPYLKDRDVSCQYLNLASILKS